MVYELLEVVDPVGFPGQPLEGHFCLIQRKITLLLIALLTGSHEVIPIIGSAPFLGDNMIDGHRGEFGTAILARMLIPDHNILAAHYHIHAIIMYKVLEFNNTRQRQCY
jgi:hypothetical protein|tara:strand:+ start:11678 stop:12004 length:327 start_codon:yes stop_codon:yes gene_type:complete